MLELSRSYILLVSVSVSVSAMCNQRVGVIESTIRRRGSVFEHNISSYKSDNAHLQWTGVGLTGAGTLNTDK